MDPETDDTGNSAENLESSLAVHVPTSSPEGVQPTRDCL